MKSFREYVTEKQTPLEKLKKLLAKSFLRPSPWIERDEDDSSILRWPKKPEAKMSMGPYGWVEKTKEASHYISLFSPDSKKGNGKWSIEVSSNSTTYFVDFESFEELKKFWFDEVLSKLEDKKKFVLKPKIWK